MEHKVIYQVGEKELLKFVETLVSRPPVISTKEACDILGMHYNSFYKLTNDPKTKLVPSKIKGKWSAKSVEDECQRIHGFRR